MTDICWTPADEGGRRCGGREWESNPPRTGWRPFPDLKSGRPTRDASLPFGCEPVARMELARLRGPVIRGRPHGVRIGRARISLRSHPGYACCRTLSCTTREA